MAYINREQVCENCNNKNCCENEKCPVYKVPTADVVPKSEVEKLKIEIEALKIANEKMYEAFTKQAEEIFEEIEKFITNECLQLKDSRGIDCYVKVSVHYGIAELKKKHTESDNSIVGTKWKFDDKDIPTELKLSDDVKFTPNRDDALDWNEAPPLKKSEDNI